jgi:hypothetical protein
MGYDQIIDEILLYAKVQQQKNRNGEYSITIGGLLKHFEKVSPGLDSRLVYDMINEIDARGWLLQRDSSTLVFDPAAL